MQVFLMYRYFDYQLLEHTFIDDDDGTDSFPKPPPPLITLCIIDEDPPLVPNIA